MRKKRLDLATNANYATGPAAGTPTKIAPPTINLTDGKIPDQAFGAQWQNYIENGLQEQIEVSAILPFRNWQEIAGLGSISLTSPARLSFNKAIGRSLIANTASNVVGYIQEFPDPNGSGAPLTIPLNPAGGGFFFPLDVAALDDNPTSPSWLVVGLNSTSSTKTIWSVSAAGVGTEQTSPVSGQISWITRDKTTGYFYALASDTNRSVLVRGPNPADTWSVLGQRGAGTPVASTSYLTAANGLLLMAYTQTPGSTQVTVERIATGAFARTVSTGFSDTSQVLDVTFSPQMGAFMLLTKNATYRFADPIGGFEAFTHTGVATPLLGCLHPTGPVLADANGIAVVPWLGDAPHKLAFGDFAGGTTPARLTFDGSALWFVQDKAGTKRVFRSMRSN